MGTSASVTTTGLELTVTVVSDFVCSTILAKKY